MGSGSSSLHQEHLIQNDDMLSEDRVKALLKEDFRKDIFDANQEGGFIQGSRYLELLALHGATPQHEISHEIINNICDTDECSSNSAEVVTKSKIEVLALLRNELSNSMLPTSTPIVTDPEIASAQRIAVEKGRMFVEKSRLMLPPPTQKEVEEQLVSVEGLNLLFACQYRRMYQDPLLYVLFDVSNPDTNVSALEHGTRIGTVVADRTLGGQRWRRLGRGNNLFETLHDTHDRAKGCPMRPKSHRNRGFTINQRNAWLGHNHAASLEIGCSQKFADALTSHLASLVGFYGPWIVDNS